jgi:hypothetical protein
MDTRTVCTGKYKYLYARKRFVSQGSEMYSRAKAAKSTAAGNR